ncbi:MAG: hypothetical protein ACTHW1_10800 [Ancrocorticia sp.]|uniref:hypothetical protein n=1 Tax=Ancrocorticia sp. TaxID=2593684 RepID=UPI003F91A138
MASWRPVRGEIYRFDRKLASVQSIEQFFADHKIIARGIDAGDTYEVELAVTGRRRRVATLNEAEDLIVPGPSVADLVEQMDKSLRKVQIEIAGHVAWGNIDLGEVDVAWDVHDPAYQPALPPSTPTPSAASSPSTDSAPSASRTEADLTPGLDEEGVEGTLPDLPEGPMLLLSDLSFAELPRFAATLGSPIAAFDSGETKAVLADNRMPGRVSPGSPEFVILLSTDPSGLDSPVLVVRHGNSRLAWDWDYSLADVPWVATSETAATFAHDQLGAGAFVTRLVGDLHDVDADAVRRALLGPAEDAPRALTSAVGLPDEVADCLDGLLEARLIPGAIVFEPKPFGERFQTTVAYEVSGRGRATPEFWRVFRKLYLDHPHVMEAFASVQAGAGSVAIVAAAKNWSKKRGKVFAAIGGALLLDAATRIITTQWVQAALEYEGLLPWSNSSADSADTPA